MNTLKAFFLFLLCSMGLSTGFAQSCLKQSFDYVPEDQLPWIARKERVYKECYICNPNGIIPDRLYENVQGTDYWQAGDNPDLAPMLYNKVKYPNSPYTLGAVMFGGVTDLTTCVLICVDDSLNITGTLEVEYRFSWITPRQFRIFEDGRIVVSTLVPLTNQSLPFGKFTQFLGQIKDETYRVNADGQFVKEEGRTVRDRRVYTRQELDSKTFNLF